MLKALLLLLLFLAPCVPAAAAPPPAQRAALAAMERLQGEIALLAALAAAQEALLARNRGLPQRRREALPEELCRAAGAWCRFLPATFGRTP